jgi:hypothetical protein
LMGACRARLMYRPALFCLAGPATGTSMWPAAQHSTARDSTAGGQAQLLNTESFQHMSAPVDLKQDATRDGAGSRYPAFGHHGCAGRLSERAAGMEPSESRAGKGCTDITAC